MKFTRRSLVVTLAATGVALAACVTALATGATAAEPSSIPFGQTVNGTATYYDDKGLGACGTSIDASSQMFVAVSHTYWTTANPNSDPLCSGVSVQLTYSGHTLTLPVVDKCPSCDAGHLDLSKPAFAELADTSVGVLQNVSWSFVKSGSDGGGTATPTSTATTVPATPSAEPTTAPSEPVTTTTPSNPAATTTPTATGTKPATAHRHHRHRHHHRKRPAPAGQAG